MRNYLNFNERTKLCGALAANPERWEGRTREIAAAELTNELGFLVSIGNLDGAVAALAEQGCRVIVGRGYSRRAKASAPTLESMVLELIDVVDVLTNRVLALEKKTPGAPGAN